MPNRCLLLAGLVALAGILVPPCCAQPTDSNQESVVGQEPGGGALTLDLDRVFIRSDWSLSTAQTIWTPVDVVERRGRIAELDASKLILEIASDGDSENGKSLRFSSKQVERIDPVWTGADTDEVLELFDQQKYGEFVQALRGLNLANIPAWQQLLILSKVVQAVDAVSGPLAAGKHFLTMSASAPDFLYADMPLCWFTNEPSPELLRAAEVWMESDDEAAQLLGASWLAQNSQSEQVRTVLRKLQGSKNSAISQLAAAQAWRQVAPPDTMERLPEWIALRDRMLRPLALGPTEFLADRLMRIGQDDLAMGQALWIATVHHDHPRRAQRAWVAAAAILKKQGREGEAEKLKRWMGNMQRESR